MGKKKAFPNRENHIINHNIKSKDKLGAGDFDSRGVFKDVEQESGTIRYLFRKDNLAALRVMIS